MLVLVQSTLLLQRLVMGVDTKACAQQLQHRLNVRPAHPNEAPGPPSTDRPQRSRTASSTPAVSRVVKKGLCLRFFQEAACVRFHVFDRVNRWTSYTRKQVPLRAQFSYLDEVQKRWFY